MPTEYASVMTNAMLREDIANGLKGVEIAAKYGLTSATVSYRIKRLKGKQVQAVVHVPSETKRYVSNQLDIMEVFAGSIRRCEKLQDACHEWLQDAKNPEKYDIGPRSHEIEVTYLTPPDEKGKRTKVKRKLSELLQIALGDEFEVSSAETKFADPRETIIKTMVETRMTAQTLLEAADRIVNQQQLDKLRNALLELYGRYEPERKAQLARDINTVSGLYVIDGDKKG